MQDSMVIPPTLVRSDIIVREMRFLGGSRLSFEDLSDRKKNTVFFYLGIPRLFKQDIDFGPSFTEQS